MRHYEKMFCIIYEDVLGDTTAVKGLQIYYV